MSRDPDLTNSVVFGIIQIMKKLLLLSSKKKLMVGGAIVILAAGGVTAALNKPQHTGADTSPLTQEVDRQGQELSNHEARISNTENDVKDLQDRTGTPPSSNRVSVPSTSSTTQVITSTPSQSASTAPSAPAPITVASSSINFGGIHDGQCTLVYTDGTSAYVTATLTTNGQSQDNNCSSFVGQTKS